jgi:hypothetical protein
LSIKDAAGYFNVSERTIRRRIKTGQLNAELVDGRYMVRICVDSDVTTDAPFVTTIQTGVNIDGQLQQADSERRHLIDSASEKTYRMHPLHAELTEWQGLCAILEQSYLPFRPVPASNRMMEGKLMVTVVLIVGIVFLLMAIAMMYLLAVAVFVGVQFISKHDEHFSLSAVLKRTPWRSM